MSRKEAPGAAIGIGIAICFVILISIYGWGVNAGMERAERQAHNAACLQLVQNMEPLTPECLEAFK